MRWKLLRRRLSVSAPRMTVRSHLPWPLRWAMLALTLGFSAALALWAFEFGKDIAGVDRRASAELARVRDELAQLRAEREQATSIVNSADSLLKAERAAQERLAQQLKQIEAENLSLKTELGFYERLLPAATTSGVSIRALKAQAQGPGHVHYQLLLMQPGKSPREFNGRYEVTLVGTLNDKPWTSVPPDGSKDVQLKQSLRLEGLVEHPPEVVVQALQVRVVDANGAVRATQTAKI